jgi:hypothetical protein
MSRSSISTGFQGKFRRRSTNLSLERYITAKLKFQAKQKVLAHMNGLR